MKYCDTSLEGVVDELEGVVNELEGVVDELEGVVDELEGVVDELEGVVNELEWWLSSECFNVLQSFKHLPPPLIYSKSHQHPKSKSESLSN